MSSPVLPIALQRCHCRNGGGRPKFYPDRLFLNVKPLVHELLAVFARKARPVDHQRVLSARRTWERRLKAIPATRLA